MPNRHSRRDLLRTLAIGAGAVPLLAPLGRNFLPRAEAADGGAPRRILFIDIPNGVIETNPQAYDEFAKPGATPSDFTLGLFLQALEPFKSDLVILDGMELKRDVQAVNTHAVGLVQLLTGQFPTNDLAEKGRANHISVDQHLAQSIGKLVTPSFPSLVMGVQTAWSHSYTADGTKIPENQDPYDGYKRLFSTLVDGPKLPDPALISRLKRRKSVLDSVATDLISLQARLGPEDRARADAQLDAIRTMESRLENAMTATPTCASPTQVAGLDYKNDKVFPDIVRMQLDLITNAFLCDLTRIATLGIRGADYQVFKCGFDPVNRPENHFHGLSHDESNDDHASFRVAKSFVFGLVAEAVAKLKAIPEAGGSVLDNTIIFIGTEIGKGHRNDDLQFVTIGGKNLGVKTGQYIQSPRGFGKGTSHTRLLVSFLNAMGMADETFGDAPGGGSGPMPGYLA